MFNVEVSVMVEMDSFGYNFDVVGKYGEKVCEKFDDFYFIYKVYNKLLDSS